MELTKVLEQLRLELEHIDAAILSLERLQAKGIRRGRPPKVLIERKLRPAAARRMTTVSRPVVERSRLDP